MAYINIICPNCGGTAQIEAGRSAMCPYCACELHTPAGGDQGFAFAPEPEPEFLSGTQFANTDLEFAEPEFVQPDIGLAAPAQMQMQQPVQASYSPQQLAEADSKRRNWYYINGALITAQTLMFALGILFTVKGYRIGVPLILTWVLTLCRSLRHDAPRGRLHQQKAIFQEQIYRGDHAALAQRRNFIGSRRHFVCDSCRTARHVLIHLHYYSPIRRNMKRGNQNGTEYLLLPEMRQRNDVI